MLFEQFAQALLDAGQLRLQLCNGLTLSAEIAGNQQLDRNQVGLETAFALAVVVFLGPDQLAILVLHLVQLTHRRARLPAVGADQVAVVLHGLGPVVHQVLVDVVMVEQGRLGEGAEQVFREFEDQLLGVAAGGIGRKAFEQRRAAGQPLLEQCIHPSLERRELRVAEDHRLDIAVDQLEVTSVAGGLEQRGTQLRHHLPVAPQGIDISLGDAAAQVAKDVLNILRLGAVDVARQVEVEVVLRVADLVEADHTRVTWHIEHARIGIDDLVDVLVAQAVFRAVFDEAFGGIDHENAFARGGVLFIQHQDAGGNAGAIKQVGRQADDGLEVAGAHQPLANHRLGIATG